MDNSENKVFLELDERASRIFSDFMTRVTKFEELVSVGSRLLVGFHQQLGLLRRPPLHKTSDVVDGIIKANQTERVKAYVETGCINIHDGIQNISKSKSLLNELECIMEVVVGVMCSTNESISLFHDKHSGDELVHQAAKFEKEEMETADRRRMEVSDYASMMGIIYSMLKQDYTMQEKIVSSLNLNSSSGELESYCLMWSLRPFINDDIMHRAWRYIL